MVRDVARVIGMHDQITCGVKHECRDTHAGKGRAYVDLVERPQVRACGARAGGLATVLSARQKNVDARQAFLRALALNPDDRHCMASLVGCDVELERLDDAEALARRAVELYPDDAIAWSNVGVVLDHQDRYAEAITAFEKAAMLSEREGAEAYNFVNHAVSILRDARTDAGIEFLEQQLARTAAVQAHCHYSLALLLAGRMEEGWEQYEVRGVEGTMKESRAPFARPA